MNKSKRSSTQRPARRSKRGQQLSLGGILLALLAALISWWSGVGRTPATQTPDPTVAPVVATTKAAAPATATPAASASNKKDTPEAEIKVVSLAQPDTPTATKKATPTVKAKATATPQKRATATLQPTRAPTKTKPPPTAKPPTPTPKPQQRRGVSGLPTILYEQLPKEARHTIDLIDQGGPFPFYKDGTVFQNREGNLPRKPRNYYQEYTVITPGEDDRGARRIVTGDRGELFYTDDHYDSFREVIR